MMAEVLQQNTGYGIFVQACWTQHERQYPDNLVHKEIQEFHKQCSLWWHGLPEEEKGRFNEVADRSNKVLLSVFQTKHEGVAQQNDFSTSRIINGSSGYGCYTYYDMNKGHQEQVLPSVAVGNGDIPEQNANIRPEQHASRQVALSVDYAKVIQKPIRDPNAPKRPLSAYFLFSQEERLKVKEENPEFSITDVAKVIGRRWATVEPKTKEIYEKRYKEAKKVYDIEMESYKPNKKRKDPKAPKHPMSAYFIFSAEQRLNVKVENPSFSFTEIAKELGRRWGYMNPTDKQKYQIRAEEERVKYEQDMISYRQALYMEEQCKPQRLHATNIGEQPTYCYSAW